MVGWRDLFLPQKWQKKIFRDVRYRIKCRFGKIINYENFYVHPENGKWKIILALLKYFDYGDKKEMIGILRNL